MFEAAAPGKRRVDPFARSWIYPASAKKGPRPRGTPARHSLRSCQSTNP